MNKKALLITTLILLIWVWGWLSYWYYYGEIKKHVTPEVIKDDVVEFPKEETLTKEQKLEQFKRRMNFRSILRKGDFYSIKNMKETALQYYLNAYKKLPNDHIIEKKIAETYFEMKNFEKSYAYYKRMPSWELDAKAKEKMLKTLLYTGNKNMRDEFNKIQAPQDVKEYYDKVLVCYTWIKNCIQEIKSYSGSTQKILDIQKSLLDFEKVASTDPNSRYAILAWAFLANNDYLAAALIWQETLQKRPNYTSVLQITWYAWFELWDYKKANEFLQNYYAINPKDVKVTYILWIINFYLENYVSSNLYFNAAVLNWYRPKTELQKRLAYNYYIIWDTKNMLKVFRYIIDEADTTQDDYAVALYTAIEEKEYSKAMLWVNKWIIRFPQSDMLYAFRWWLYNIRDDQSEALTDLSQAISMNARNAVALYNLWLLSLKKNDYTIAKTYFENTIEADKNWTFWEDAIWKIKDIEALEKQATLSWSESSWTTNAN
jgi:hypothetical protein